ncbi:LacI family DNA-binding transcriptional regulator [Nocardiopsis salina]|uniref:LacI family DNA-binding transcriptional regulator n=1 Tax=Nocardiopsis salina TaxID=245836 RepID=UPI0019554612|nr:LacI family DNA-binding transcriptional regulator [Nocardiopsis salina]
MGGTLATSRDVARRAGVSQATVSRVLQGNTNVSEGKRELVERAMADLGYRPNAAARAIRMERTLSVGVVVADITNPFYPQLLEAVSQELERVGAHMVLWNSDEPGHAGVLEAVRRGSVDGLLFTTVSELTEPLAESLRRNEPVLLLHRGLDTIDCDQVTSDNEHGARMVADYLVGAGCERIGYVQGPARAGTALHRDRGFRGRLAELGRPQAEERTRRAGFSHAEARGAMRELMQCPEPPTAVFCANDLAAFGAIDGALSLGLRVPEDVWVVGFDDTEMASWDAYSLTTVRQPIDSMARTAVRRLLERIDVPDLNPVKRNFTCSFVVRGSSAHTPFPDSH